MTGHRETRKDESFLPVDREDVIDDRSSRNKKDEFSISKQRDVIDDRSSIKKKDESFLPVDRGCHR